MDLHWFARQPGSVATAGIGFRKTTRHTQAQMPALGSVLRFGSRRLADGCSYPAAARQSGHGVRKRCSAAWLSGAGGGQVIGIKTPHIERPYLRQSKLAVVRSGGDGLRE